LTNSCEGLRRDGRRSIASREVGCAGSAFVESPVGGISSIRSFSKYGLHGASRFAEKLRAADAGEDPTHAFKDGLPVHAFGKPFEGVIAVSVAFDSQALIVAFNVMSNSMSFDLRPNSHASIRPIAD
jgi:hypothetical protein